MKIIQLRAHLRDLYAEGTGSLAGADGDGMITARTRVDAAGPAGAAASSPN